MRKRKTEKEERASETENMSICKQSRVTSLLNIPTLDDVNENWGMEGKRKKENVDILILCLHMFSPLNGLREKKMR